METNKIDKVFKDAFKNRTITPSNSAWNRLSEKIEIEEKQTRKKRYLFLGYAASLLVFVTFSYFHFSKESHSIEKQQEIVDTTPVENDTKINATPKIILENKILEDRNEIVVENATKELKPKIEKAKDKSFFHKNEESEESITVEPSKVLVAENTTAKLDTMEVYALSNTTQETPKNTKKRKLKIDALQLLASVENEDEIERNYLSRAEKLKIIEKELKYSSININPEKLLAEVEKNTEEKTFREKFLISVKNNISSLATVITEKIK